MKDKILVVDDEKPIADILKFNLKKEDYSVEVAYDGEEALTRAQEEDPDLIILDIMLPEKDGFTVCRQLRQNSDVPILMLTAKEDEVDKVLGLELGADDYVTKPFSPREVLARVKALLRRTKGAMARNGNEDSDELKVGAIRIDLAAYEVTKGGEEVNLTKREFELLKYFAQHKGKALSREVLLEDVWGYEYYGDIRTVDVTVRRLREKIEDDPSNPSYLLTKRGVGYLFTGGER